MCVFNKNNLLNYILLYFIDYEGTIFIFYSFNLNYISLTLKYISLYALVLDTPTVFPLLPVELVC